VLLSRVVEASSALSTISSRNGKRAILGELMTELVTEGDADQAAVVAAWMSGGLRQRRTGVGWASLTGIPSPAAEPTLTVTEVDRAFAELAEIAGAGSAADRAAQVNQLFGRATEPEQRLLIGLVSGELRHGALEALVQEGLAAALGLPAATVRRAAMLLGSTAVTAALAVDQGPAALAAVGMHLGVPVQPMLASSAPSVAEAVARTGLPVVVDHKLDGIRVQVHRDGADVRVFTRSLDDITPRLPEVVDAVRTLPANRLVLDGEVLALRADGRPEKFQVIASRTASSAARPGRDGTDARPVTAYFFDLMLVDERNLLDTPLRERLSIMTEVVPETMRVPRMVADDEATVASTFAAAVADGFEGVVIKNLDSTYAAGRREASWTKIKPRHTLDLVVLAAEWGHGRREGWLSNLHLGARGPDGLVMLGKTFKGLTDELLRWQTERLLALQTRATAHTVFVRPELVVEIAFDGVQDSTRYPGKVALRFARVLRYREDKTVDRPAPWTRCARWPDRPGCRVHSGDGSRVRRAAPGA